MKKILLLILPLFFLLFSAQSSFAQNSSGVLFAPEEQTKAMILDNTKPQTFFLKPFTSVTIEANTFSEKPLFFIYMPGRWDEIKKAFLTENDSPIISYRFIFINLQGRPITPTKPIKINASNSYTNTSTYYYPLNVSLTIDKQNQKKLPGPTYAKLELPINDNAFIISVNKFLDQNDPIFGRSQKNKATPTPASFLGNLSTITLYKIGVVALILVILGIIGILYYSKKKPRKSKRVEEPTNIIVGK